MTAREENKISKNGNDFIVWRAYQGRVDSMQPFFGYRVHWLGFRFHHRALRPLEYVIKSIATLWLLARYRPAVTWIQVPPTPLVYVIALARGLRLTRSVVADCHNSILWKPWINSPFLLRLFRKSVKVAIFHNQEVAEQARQAGFDEKRLFVLEERPAVPSASTATPPTDEHANVLFPSSFDPDEPIGALLEAARRMPELKFIFTGDSSRAKGVHDLGALPHNANLTGWVSIAEYKRLLMESNVVISLTTQEGIQTSAAGEAVGNGKAMVLSDTKILRALYPKGAVYTRSDADGLETSIRQALDNQSELEQESQALRGEREEHWRARAQLVEEAIRSLG